MIFPLLTNKLVEVRDNSINGSFITVFLSHSGAFLESSLIFAKKYVHFSKQFVQTAPHTGLPAKACNLMLSHVVNITVHSVSRLLPAVKYGNSLDDSYCTEMQKASFLTYAIYPFQKYKFTHYCFETFELQ